MTLGFAGRVAVITGAGGGLGRCYALEFAKRGARVVVNDLGGGMKGEGSGTKMADKVVKEIKDAGGEAVANYDSVEDGEKIINTAIENFGKVDILINNAGILRDRSFGKITDEDWSKIFKVHVNGAFKCTQAAWPHMRKQKSGCVLMTTSAAGLYGNFGQTNYSAAKSALVGMARTLSIEGKRSNIRVNCLAPVAETRLTAELLPGFGLDPEFVTPFVIYLCHDICPDSGIILETAAGLAYKTRLESTKGVQLREHIGDTITAERVSERWNEIGDFMQPTEHLLSARAATEKVVNSISTIPEQPLPADATPCDKVRAYRLPEVTFSYTPNNAIMYALGVGAGLPNDAHFLYEGSDAFAVIPSYVAIMGQSEFIDHLVNVGIAGMEGIDISRVIHGEQYLEVIKSPLPTSGTFTVRSRCVDLLDKRKFAQLVVEYDVVDDQGETMARSQGVYLFLGAGGMGRRGKCEQQVPTARPPSREPDFTTEDKTSVDQAALYRINGDPNPLHIDPELASALGFEKPILHGLCSYGFSLRHVLRTYCNNQTSTFKCVKAQFSKPVIPGQTLQTEMWHNGMRVFFRTRVKETGEIVMKDGYVDFTEEVKPPQQSEKSVEDTVEKQKPQDDLKTPAIMKTIEEKLKNASSAVLSKLKGAFLFQITKSEKLAGEYLIDFTTTPVTVAYGPPSTQSVDVTLRLDDSVMHELFLGALNPMQAFMQKKLKLTGKIMLAQQLGKIFQSGASKL